MLSSCNPECCRREAVVRDVPAGPVDLVARVGPPRHHRPCHLGRRAEDRSRAGQHPRRRDPRHPVRPPVHPAVPHPAQRLPAAHVRHLADLLHRSRLHLLPLPARSGQPPAGRRLPDHGSVSLREDALTDAIAGFLVFGHDRAALLTALLPAASSEQAGRAPGGKPGCTPNWPASTPPNAA